MAVYLDLSRVEGPEHLVGRSATTSGYPTPLGRRLGCYTPSRKIGDRGFQIVHLDDEVINRAHVLDRSSGVMDQLEADERIVGQPQHGKAAKLRLGDPAEHGVAERGIEGERAFQVCDSEPDVQHAHARQI
jgi:hypothetical protein